MTRSDNPLSRVRMMSRWLLVWCGVLLATPANSEATESLVVLSFENHYDAVAESTVRLAEDLVRGSAVDALGGRMLVLTRENMLQLLPPDTALDECVEAHCEVELGRRLGTTHVVSGSVVRTGAMLHVSVRVHDTRTSALLSQRVFEAADEAGLISALRSGLPRWCTSWAGVPSEERVVLAAAAQGRSGTICERAQSGCFQLGASDVGVLALRGRSGGRERGAGACVGQFATQPNHVLEIHDPLRQVEIHVVRADGDTTLRVEGGDRPLCNDDLVGRNPGVVARNLQPGTYAIWVGSFDHRPYDYHLEIHVH